MNSLPVKVPISEHVSSHHFPSCTYFNLIGLMNNDFVTVFAWRYIIYIEREVLLIPCISLHSCIFLHSPLTQLWTLALHRRCTQCQRRIWVVKGTLCWCVYFWWGSWTMVWKLSSLLCQDLPQVIIQFCYGISLTCGTKLWDCLYYYYSIFLTSKGTWLAQCSTINNYP